MNEKEPFLISPEDLKALDIAIREIENGYEPRPFDLSLWDIEENEGARDNGNGT